MRRCVRPAVPHARRACERIAGALPGQARARTFMSGSGKRASFQLRMGSVPPALPLYAMLKSSRKMRQSRSVISSTSFSVQCFSTRLSKSSYASAARPRSLSRARSSFVSLMPCECVHAHTAR